ncbi:MAG: aldehyde dehydrogenase family protein [Oculatellaceae cyanobacterium bins.114]|nr:aldehyde dehydrogenase family protein [Oculatellaceae cyanobacterium bins.114]
MSMLTVINPATGAVLQELPVDDSEAIAHKVAQAKAAQPEWAARPMSERIDIIRQFNGLLTDHAESLAQQLTAEMGKPIKQARAEVGTTSSRIGYFLDQVAAVLATETVLHDPSLGLKEQISHEPLGVIANISAWNYPFFVGSNVFIPALLAGNAVLYKPSEFASLTGLSIAQLMAEAGIPEGIFQAVIGTGQVGAELLTHPLNGVFFTGSYATGCKIAIAAAPHLMKVQLELGGKDPVYVAEDVSVASVAPAVADGAFYNTGQSCCAVERIYVHEQVYEPFVDAFMATVRDFQVGDPTDENTYIGSLARPAQVDFLKYQVEDALAKGAKLLCGGDPKGTGIAARLDRPGAFFAPTVLVNVDHSMSVMRDESFGPIIGIQSVPDDSEALRLMQDTSYGLTAGIYTASEARAEAMLRQLNSGTVYWNCCDRVSPRLPWSGRGHSGIGLTLSTYGIQTFTQPKAWHLRNG